MGLAETIYSRPGGEPILRESVDKFYASMAESAAVPGLDICHGD